MLCHNCGNVLEKGVLYCTDCGTAVSFQSTQAMGTPAQKGDFPSTGTFGSPGAGNDDFADASVQPNPPVDDFIQPAATSRRSRRALIIIVSILILFIAAIAAALMLKSNTPPTLDPIEVSAALVHTGDTVILTAHAKDSDGDRLDYQWSSSAGQIRGSGERVTLDTSAVDAAQGRKDVKVTLTVSDGRGGSVSTDRPITVLPAAVITNASTAPLPMTLDLEADRKSVTAGEAVSLTARVANRDPSQLIYEWKTSAGSLQTSGPRAALDTSSIKMSAGSKKITITLTARDQNGEIRSDSETISLVAAQPANWPPVITLRASRSTVYQGEDIEITANATDRDGDSLNYQWNTSHGQLTGNGNRMTLRTSAIAPAQVEVWATVSDGRGESATDRLIVSVIARPNRPPVIARIDSDRARVEAGARVTLTAIVSDPEGDSLRYIWSSSAGEIRGSGERVALDTSSIENDSGAVQVRVSLTVRDQGGGTATENAIVTVTTERREEEPRAGPLRVSSSAEGEDIIITVTDRPTRAVSSSGTIIVSALPGGATQATGLLPASIAYLTFGSLENLSKDRVSFAETPGPSNSYSRMKIRIRPKKAGKPVRFTINWSIR
jgi:hypothetical protein